MAPQTQRPALPTLVFSLCLVAAGLHPHARGESPDSPFVVVLGIAQDAGYPHAGCHRECCRPAWENDELRQYAACLGIVDPVTRQRWLVECTPDFRRQLHALDRLAPPARLPGIAGVLLTHAHVGHYAGLVHLGREAMGTHHVPVYAMPRMRQFLEANGPWNQLIALENIRLRPLTDQTVTPLNERLSATPLIVPHRDEYSETVALVIRGPRRQVLFLPDIDKWERWGTPIEELLEEVDCAYVDGTFFTDTELPDRDMAEIPHPLIVESLARFAPLASETRAKIRFIHLNHSNPALRPASPARSRIEAAGLGIARQGEIFRL